MANQFSGVFPCYENQFQIGENAENLNSIKDMESFSVAFDNQVEEWNPYDTQGWVRRLMTAKSVTISVSGKRNIGDTGNDLVAGLWLKNGREVEKPFQWTFPDGTTVLFDNAVINVTAFGASDSTSVAPLEFEVMSNGKPTVTVAA